jgi:adenosine deaminase
LINVDLYNYIECFKEVLYDIYMSLIKQNCLVVELKHVSGFLFDKDKNSLSIEKELDAYLEVIDRIKKEYPNFDSKVQIIGLKVFGLESCQEVIEKTITGMKYKDLVTGYDLVNAEDTTAPISDFRDMILAARRKTGGDFPVWLHAGESQN